MKQTDDTLDRRRQVDSRSYLINGFVARKPQNRRGGNSRKAMIWLSLKRFVL
jgi:hypothetical protein